MCSVDEKRVEGYHRFQTKIWQALRFCFLNEEGYEREGAVKLGPYEEWIRARTGAAVARVRAALDDYRFNDAANEIYAFVWGEFCDWYLELSKTTIYDKRASKARQNGVKHTLFDTMAVIMQLLHPMMPFLTEEIWNRLPNTEGFVTRAPYPKAEDFGAEGDEAVLTEIAELQAAVTEIRRIRGEMEIALRTELKVHVAEDALFARLNKHKRALWDLARIKLVHTAEAPKASATGVVSGATLVIPLAGVVDISAEVARLDKVLAKSDKDVAQLEKRLSNKGFVDRAPPEVVDEVREKLEAALARQKTLRTSRDRLAEAL